MKKGMEGGGMNRRNFLKSTIAAGAMLGMVGAADAAPELKDAPAHRSDIEFTLYDKPADATGVLKEEYVNLKDWIDNFLVKDAKFTDQREKVAVSHSPAEIEYGRDELQPLSANGKEWARRRIVKITLPESLKRIQVDIQQYDHGSFGREKEERGIGAKFTTPNPQSE